MMRRYCGEKKEMGRYADNITRVSEMGEGRDMVEGRYWVRKRWLIREGERRGREGDIWRDKIL